MLQQIDYEVADLMILSKTEVPKEINDQLKKIASVFEDESTPNANAFALRFGASFYQDFIQIQSPDMLITMNASLSDNQVNPLSLQELHNRIVVWKKRLEKWIEYSLSYPLPSVSLHDLHFILHDLTLPSYAGPSKGSIQQVRTINPRLYHQAYQNRFFEITTQDNQKSYFSIQHFHHIDLLFSLSASFMQYALSVIWNNNSRCRKRGLTAQMPTIVPVNRMTAYVESDIDSVNLHGILLELLQENHMDQDSVLMEFVEKKRQYLIDPSARTLNDACRCRIQNGLSSYMYRCFLIFH